MATKKKATKKKTAKKEAAALPSTKASPRGEGVVAYTSNDEAIVAALCDEARLLDRCFSEGCGRDVRDYDRLVSSGPELIITSRLCAD
jgi:hypothetical protein